MICNFEVYETKFCQYEYWAAELEAALKIISQAMQLRAEAGGKARRMKKQMRQKQGKGKQVGYSYRYSVHKRGSLRMFAKIWDRGNVG